MVNHTSTNLLHPGNENDGNANERLDTDELNASDSSSSDHNKEEQSILSDDDLDLDAYHPKAVLVDGDGYAVRGFQRSTFLPSTFKSKNMKKQIIHIKYETSCLMHSISSARRKFKQLFDIIIDIDHNMPQINHRFEKVATVVEGLKYTPENLKVFHEYVPMYTPTIEMLEFVYEKTSRKCKAKLDLIKSSYTKIDLLINRVIQLSIELHSLTSTVEGPTCSHQQHAMVLLRGIGGDYDRAVRLIPKLEKSINRIQHNFNHINILLNDLSVQLYSMVLQQRIDDIHAK